VGFYERMQGRADALLRKYGKARAVTRIVHGALNTATGMAAETPTTATVYVATFPYEQNFVNGKTIRAGDLWGFFSAKGLAFVPQPGDTAVVDGKTYTFGPVKPLQPAGVAVLYECHLTEG
jgi:hypothetical protein